MEVDLQAILDVLNAWADADLAALRATRDELAKQVLPRLPKVLPRCACGRTLGHPGRHTGHGGRAPRALKPSGRPGGAVIRARHDL